MIQVKSMKALKIAVAIVISVTSIFWASCTLIRPAAVAPKVQTANVQRGDLTIDITASGNLALAKTEDLAFELAGYVSEVLVKEGDQVKEGQVIAKLDTTDWDKQVKALDKKLTAAQRSLTTMEANLTKAQRQVSTKEFAVQQAELAVKTAENNLKQITEVEAAQDEIDKAERDMKYAQTVLETSMKSASSGYDLLSLQRTVINAKEQIAQAQKNLQDILKGISVKVTSNVALHVTTSQMQIEQGRRALEDAQIAVDDARTAVANARLDKGDADQTVKDAQSDLDEAKSLSPVVKAPFAGFITKVNVKGGDEIFKGKVAVQLADPEKFEADILVSEKDIVLVKLGGQATVQLGNVSSVSFPAKIASIAPTATIQSGVVNYKVKVELESSQPGRPGTSQSPAGSQPSQPGTSQGQTGSQPSQAQGARTRSGTGQTSGIAVNPQSVQLREGLSITVNIRVDERKSVVLVPNRAIVRQGKDMTVKVVKDGVTTSKTVKVGINNAQYTEVMEGLNEGEQVVLQQVTAPTATSSSPGAGQPLPMMIPR